MPLEMFYFFLCNSVILNLDSNYCKFDYMIRKILQLLKLLKKCLISIKKILFNKNTKKENIVFNLFYLFCNTVLKIVWERFLIVMRYPCMNTFLCITLFI